MVDYTDLLQDVSYHLRRNLYAPLQLQFFFTSNNIAVMFTVQTVMYDFIELYCTFSVFEKRSVSIFMLSSDSSLCIRKSTSYASLSILECFAAIMLHTKTTSYKIGRLSVTEVHTKVQIGTQKNGGWRNCEMADYL